MSKRIEARTLAFTGIERGSGATCLSVAMANYLAAYEGEKTAHICMSGRAETEALREFEKDKYFTVYGVTYLPLSDPGELPEAFYFVNVKKYDRVIIDLGTLCEKNLSEFKRSDRGYLVGGMMPWQIETVRHRVENFMLSEYNSVGFPIIRNFRFLAFGGSVNERVFKDTNIRLPVIRVPYIEDPLDIKKEQRAFFNKLI